MSEGVIDGVREETDNKMPPQTKQKLKTKQINTYLLELTKLEKKK